MSPSLLVCVICDEKCDSKDALQDHFRIHANGGGKRGNRSKEVKKTTSISIECDVCSEVFDSTTKAISHKFKKHPTSHNSYFCPWCGKQFPIKQILNNHMNTHSDCVTPATVIPCTDCGNIFYTKEGVTYHCQQFHKKAYLLNFIQTPPPSKKICLNGKGDVHSAYYCHLCGNEYIVKYNLQRHINRVHGTGLANPPEDMIKCTVCDALFYSIKAYDFHKTFHTPSDLYVTSEEMRQQVVTRVDQDFDFRRIKLDPVNRNLPNNTGKLNSNILDLQAKMFSDIGNMSSLSPPPADTDSDEDLSSLDKSQPQAASENAITIEEFLHMNKDVFGDCFSGEKDTDKRTESDVAKNPPKINETIKDNTNIPQSQEDNISKVCDKVITKSSDTSFLEKLKPVNGVPKNVKEIKLVKRVVVPKGVLKPGMQVLTKKDFELLQKKGILSLAPTKPSPVESSPSKSSSDCSSVNSMNLKEVRINVTRLNDSDIRKFMK